MHVATLQRTDYRPGYMHYSAGVRDSSYRV
jgi:hypothetical protein